MVREANEKAFYSEKALTESNMKVGLGKQQNWCLRFSGPTTKSPHQSSLPPPTKINA